MENKKLLLEKFFEMFPTTYEFGFFRRKNDNRDRYFCTPVNAEIIGWTGVDGIHICFISAVDPDMVFVVNPENSNSYVYPIAQNFEDFLSLLLFLGEFSPMEQPICYVKNPEFHQSKQTFLEFTSKGKAEMSKEHKRELEMLQDQFQLNPKVNAYNYLYDLQQTFNYSLIPFTDDFF